MPTLVVNTSVKNSAITTVAAESLKSHTAVTAHAQNIYSVTQKPFVRVTHCFVVFANCEVTTQRRFVLQTPLMMFGSVAVKMSTAAESKIFELVNAHTTALHTMALGLC